MALRIQESTIRRLGRTLGLRGPDLRELTELEDEGESFNRLPVPIIGELTGEEKDTELASDVQNYCQHISWELRTEFRELLRERQQVEGSKLTPTLVQRMQELELDVPKFEIYIGDARIEFVDSLGFERRWYFETDSVVVLFDFPKVLSQFWWKGGAGEPDPKKRVEKMAVEWRQFYTALTPTVWRATEQEAEDAGFDFWRINPTATHTPRQYYYIWEVMRTKAHGH